MNTDFGGLLGVVYADVVQFGIMITGCTVFLALAVSHHGGWTAILQRVHEIRPTGLAQTPPTPSIDVLTLVVLFLQGWFFAGSPSFLINWGGSFVVNDLMPTRFSKADGKIWISRLISLALFLFAAVVTILFVDNMVSWFMFINSAMVIFLLPLSGLRFFWWRFNVWGELSAIALVFLFLIAVLPLDAAELPTNFSVSLPAKQRPFPEPLGRGQQPGFKFRGTKGWAWTPEQYLAEIPWLAKFKMNFLMNCYSSMFDLEHYPNWAQANRWWEDFPEAKKKAYENVVRECQKQGIQFCFSMNPDIAGQRMVNDNSPESIELLYKHYAWMQSLGVKWFNISLDDISQGINASSQARVVNEIFHRLRAKDPQAQMIFCPTYYWGVGTGEKQQPYLEVLSRELDKDIYMFWTGDYCVGAVTRQGAETFRRICGHRLFLWDNYPVNDNNPTMHLGPVVNRDARLGEVIDGYMSNPHCKESQINRIPLATCADYSYNPRAYDPARSIGQAILHLGRTPAECETLRELVEAYPGMLIYSQHNTGFNSVQYQFDQLLKKPDSPGAGRAYLNHLQLLSDRMALEFPDRYRPAQATLAGDIQKVKKKLSASNP
jgi:hypothetical protein